MSHKEKNVELKPCPLCGSTVRKNKNNVEDGYSYACQSDPKACRVISVEFIGTDAECDAAWNAMPRREDKAAGMSDGELVARAIRNHSRVVVVTSEADGVCSDDYFEDVDAELDRRESLRK